MPNYETDFEDDWDDTEGGGDTGGEGGSGGGPDKKPFVMRGYLVQGELAKGERRFGEIEWSVRQTDPPPPEVMQSLSNEYGYGEENGLAAANGSVVEQHEWLVCQQFDGRDPVRDQRIPSVADILEYAENHPEAQLTLDPQLKLALENAKRHQFSATPTLKPAGL